MKDRLKEAMPFLVIMCIVALCIQFIYKPQTRESIIFFPINENVSYETATTILMLQPEKKNDHYEVNWKLTSKLDTPAYLRQDVGFLFMNGRLKGLMNEWEQDTDQIVEESTIKGKDSSILQAVSFHYSEIHESDTEFTSAQKMSEDALYVIDSNFSPLNAFRQPGNSVETEWKNILDKVTSQQLEYLWEKAITSMGIPADEYTPIPLTSLPMYDGRPLEGFSRQEWDRLIGNLWEGLYKNYYLGIKKEDGSVVESIDSAIPLLLVKKDKKEVLVLLVDQNGDASLLRQLIS
ncbi:hypothetical protein N5C46_22790 [Rossellomorea vietnamensis]|uniref:Uncharacterized protein n=1 Tax=Rossellomorea vietnamensis TaxID=218284 RepID=A0ACD4C7N5_9BACI|nr:hypothetical protein [Rossellomorea vietnamensis]UXH44409.1 hypothetical protein N5C46_22790 [Rossellomorea vietnamensis]